MSTQTITPPRARRLWPRIALAVVLLAGAAGAGYWWWQSRRIPVPVYSTEGLDPAIAKAIDDARAAVQHSPRSSQAWANYALVLFAHDKYLECRAPFEQREKMEPEEARWPYYRALALKTEKPAECEQALRKALALRPRFEPFKLRLAEQLLESGQLDEAERLFRELLKSGKFGEARAWIGIGQIYLRREQWNEALEPLRKAASDLTCQQAAHTALATAYFRLGKEGLSQDERAKAGALPDDDAWLDPLIMQAYQLRTGLQVRIERVWARAGNDQLEQAIADARQIIHDYPTADVAQITLGKLLVKAGEPKSAELAFREALTINPRHAEGQFLLGGLLMQRHDLAGAEDCYRRAVTERPTFGRAHFNLGHCRFQRGNKTGAEQAFRDAIRTTPNYSSLAELLLDEHQRDEAVFLLELAQKIDPDNPQVKELLVKARKQ